MKLNFGKVLGLAVATAAFLGLTGVSHAAVITWLGAQNITTDTDVANNGTFVDATQVVSSAYGSYGPLPVNGVTFGSPPPLGAGTFGQPYSYTSAIGDITFSVGNQQFGGYNAGLTATTNYKDLVSENIYNVGNGGLQLLNLTTGTEYQVEVWVNQVGSHATAFQDTSGGLSSGFLSSGSGSSAGQYVIGTFTIGSADAGTETINLLNNDGYTILSAVSLRSLPIAAPEPASLGLLGVGAMGLLFRRKARKVA